jgi:hypothetical protein
MALTLSPIVLLSCGMLMQAVDHCIPEGGGATLCSGTEHLHLQGMDTAQDSP